MAALIAEICVSPPTTYIQVRLGLPGRIRQDLSDETVQAKFDACRCFFSTLHIGQPAKPKVCHSSFGFLLFVRKNLGPPVRKHERQFG